MAGFNAEKIMSDIKKRAGEDLKRGVIADIKQKFPMIDNFSVKVDITTGKIVIEGLTEEQVAQL